MDAMSINRFEKSLYYIGKIGTLDPYKFRILSWCRHINFRQSFGGQLAVITTTILAIMRGHDQRCYAKNTDVLEPRGFLCTSRGGGARD